MDVKMIFGFIVGLVFAGILLPIGLDAILGATLPSTLDANLQTLIVVVIPLSAVIGIVYGFLRSSDII